VGSSGSGAGPWVGGQSWLRGRAGTCFCRYSGCHPWRREEAGALHQLDNVVRDALMAAVIPTTSPCAMALSPTRDKASSLPALRLPSSLPSVCLVLHAALQNKAFIGIGWLLPDLVSCYSDCSVGVGACSVQ
jgi:hypothetical protein